MADHQRFGIFMNPSSAPSSAPSSPAVAIERWGKDHWSALAYVEALCVEGNEGVGTLNLRRLRCNAATHPTQAVNRTAWRPSYGTRLGGYFDFADRADPVLAQNAGVQLPQHDDWDCLEDLQDAGLIEVLTWTNGFVRISQQGQALASALRAHKADGGMFANFTPTRIAQAA
jgi:hypothetical protein